jgi:hypothetical protein
MKVRNRPPVDADPYTLDLPLIGGVVQAQRLVIPPEAVMRIPSFRHACRLAWRLRRVRITQRTLAAHAGLYASHVSDYFSPRSERRELPARYVAAVERVIGNTVISQYLAHAAKLTLLEEMQAASHYRRQA